jgi:hypothetical protein
MSKKSARGFGKKTSTDLSDEEQFVLEVSSMLTHEVAAEKLAELDPSKTQPEWKEWLIRAVALRFAEEISNPNGELDALIEKFR